MSIAWLKGSKSANSSVGERMGSVSESPLICVTSMTGSHFILVRAYSAVIGRPSLSTSLNIKPPLMFELCGMAVNDAPVRADVSSSHAQRSSGFMLSNEL